MKRIVCDTGALISLEKIRDGYGFIRLLYDKLLLPPAVFAELTFDDSDADASIRR